MKAGRPSEIKTLAEYALRPATGLQLALTLSRALDLAPASDTGVPGVMLYDLLNIVKWTSVGSPRVSGNQLALVREFYIACRLFVPTDRQSLELIETWLNNQPINLSCLKLLGLINHDDRFVLRELYISFARLAATGHHKQLALVIAEIYKAARNQEEIARNEQPPSNDHRPALESLLHQKYRQVLGVTGSATAAEIKAAYHRSVRLWHPDRLDGMAPELRAVATERLGDINVAYSALSVLMNAEFSGEDCGGATPTVSPRPRGTAVIMPQMGESIVEGTLTKWLKNVGERVELDEALFEISTDKVDAEIPSPVAGTVLEIYISEGTTVPIDTVVCFITEEAIGGVAVDPLITEERPIQSAVVGTDMPGQAAVTAVIMPQMGESITEGTLTKWLKGVGDVVERDEPLFEISTDKVDAEIPSPTSGTLKEIVVQEGATVEINTVVALIA